MLKACAECGKPVSTQAIACPHCGNQPVAGCDACFERRLMELEPAYPRCHSPHGVCPVFYDSEEDCPWRAYDWNGKRVPLTPARESVKTNHEE